MFEKLILGVIYGILLMQVRIAELVEMWAGPRVEPIRHAREDLDGQAEYYLFSSPEIWSGDFGPLLAARICPPPRAVPKYDDADGQRTIAA